jgi:hypothetical protein
MLSPTIPVGTTRFSTHSASRGGRGSALISFHGPELSQGRWTSCSGPRVRPELRIDQNSQRRRKPRLLPLDSTLRANYCSPHIV